MIIQGFGRMGILLIRDRLKVVTMWHHSFERLHHRCRCHLLLCKIHRQSKQGLAFFLLQPDMFDLYNKAALHFFGEDSSGSGSEVFNPLTNRIALSTGQLNASRPRAWWLALQPWLQRPHLFPRQDRVFISLHENKSTVRHWFYKCSFVKTMERTNKIDTRSSI